MMQAILDTLNPFEAYKRYQAMRAFGILGMNQRNHAFIARYNDRALYPLVDNKLKTKELALEYQLTTPDLLGVVNHQHDVLALASMLEGHQGFCIKPAKGSGGKGILVIKAVGEKGFQRTNDEWVPLSFIERHVSNILAGLFSLGGAMDVAMIESLLTPSSVFSRFSHQGVPDIRVIVFRGIPIMAMMRLACAASFGKANLHQGAVGVGLSIDRGHAINAVQKGKVITHHPDTHVALSELVVPHWDDLLRLSCACYETCSLGYLGVDLVIDEKTGPTLLELNARPGLAIQIANNAGLLPRLEKVQQLKRPELMPIDEKMDFAKRHFSTVIESTI